MKTLFAALLLSLCAYAQVPSTYFGMSATSAVLYSQGWPTVTAGGIRLWDTTSSWPNIQPNNSYTYDWSVLDLWLAGAAAHNEDVMYTLARVPQWASSNPNDNTCSFGPGQCDPPSDLNADGTGTNQKFKTFVTALANHANGRIKYWEIWNEPQNAFYWTGTYAQMVRIAQDARTTILGIMPSAVIVSPGTGLLGGAVTWTAGFLNAGGGQYVDVIAFHGYIKGSCPSTLPDTGEIISKVANFRNMLTTYGQQNKPLWNTEASWGLNASTCFTDLDKQAGFVAQMHLLYSTVNVDRFYWYQFDNTGLGGLFKNGSLIKPGLAYQQIYNQLTTAPLNPCWMDGSNVWSCILGSQGTSPMYVWIKNGPVNYTTPSWFAHYTDVYGTLFNIPANHIVSIGYNPILLQP